MSRTSGPGELVVKAGNTRHSVASVITAANAPPLPAAWNSTTWWRTAPTSNDSPTIPLQVIMTAAKTVSRGERGGLRSPGGGDAEDQPHLDDRHGDREDQRAERLPDPVRDHLGVVHGHEHRADQDDRDDRDERRPELAVPHEREEQQGEDGRSGGAEHGDDGTVPRLSHLAQDPGAGLSPVLRNEASRVSTWNQNGAPRLAASTESSKPAITATTSGAV